MSLEIELQNFYDRHGFGDTIGARTLTVPVYTGCMLVPLPNIETRHRYLKYHDLHHLMTGFSVGRIGEGRVSAWELGTGSMWASPLLGTMNLIALSTGWILDRDKMWQAFLLGRRSRNLYREETRRAIDEGDWASVDALRDDFVGIDPERPARRRERLAFGSYVAASLVIHGLLALPAMIVRTVSDLVNGKSFRETLSPAPRSDLF